MRHVQQFEWNAVLEISYVYSDFTLLRNKNVRKKQLFR